MGHIKERQFEVPGIDLDRTLAGLSGLEGIISVSAANDMLDIRYDLSQVGMPQIAKAMHRAGYALGDEKRLSLLYAAEKAEKARYCATMGIGCDTCGFDC
jgi:hypothetical protein